MADFQQPATGNRSNPLTPQPLCTALRTALSKGVEGVLRWRIVSSCIIIVVLVVACWLDFAFNFNRPGVWLLPICFIVCWLATVELIELLSAKYAQSSSRWAHLGVLGIYLPPIVPLLAYGYIPGQTEFRLQWIVLGVAFAVMVAFVRELIAYQQPGGVVSRIALALFSMIYVGLLGSFLAALRTFQGNEWGMLALLSMIVVVKLSDIGAYTAGHLFGRHKLAPILSPGKTVEGFIGGLVAGCVGSWIMLHMLATHFVGQQLVSATPWKCILYGALLTLAGLLGDLCESLIKRDVQQKDSSRRLPGFGGILDLTDSLVFAAPTAFAFWQFGVFGP